jgi:hypothetical protein
MPRSWARRQRAALGWGLAFFALAQLALVLTMECWRPELADPEYGLKLACLRARLAEGQNCRPLILVLGSSRVSMGFRPEDLVAGRSPNGRAPLVFNFGLCQFGPTGQLLCLRRLLADGIRPDAVFVELYPPLLAEDGAIIDQLDIHRLRWNDETMLRRFVSRPSVLRRRWWRGELVPFFHHRYLLWNLWLPALLEENNRLDMQWRGLQAKGWVVIPAYVKRQTEIEKRVVKSYQHLQEHFEVCDVADRALRELVALCRERKITVLCLILPESSAIRDERATGTQELERFEHQLEQDLNLPIIDGRGWVADEDMVDGVHLTHRGALIFSRLLEQRVLGRLIEGWSEDHSRAAAAKAF